MPLFECGLYERVFPCTCPVSGPDFPCWNFVVSRFYQHLPTSCDWDWGLVWGHAISDDMVHWEHLPPALRPSPGFLDADGCFSGCCTIDEAGVPTIMYTGVRLRSNQDCGPLPPADCDLQLPFIESQLMARCDPSATPRPQLLTRCSSTALPYSPDSDGLVECPWA